jgi:hypothetical protein
VIYPGSVERTSFAEKEEEKGFYDIEISSDKAGGWKPPELKFMKLPTRPMVDLVLDGSLRKEGLSDFLRTKLSGMHPDAIVRISSSGAISESLRAAMTSAFLKKVFPHTMNYQLSSSLFRTPPERSMR